MSQSIATVLSVFVALFVTLKIHFLRILFLYEY